MNSVSHPPSFSNSTTTRAEQAFTVYAVIFIASLVITQVIAGKYFLFRGAPLSCRNIIYPTSFLVTNIVAEVYGRRQASLLVMHGLIVSILVTVLAWIANNVPIAATSPVDAGSFGKVFGCLPGMVISSLVAYLTAQLLNLYLFERLRALSKRKYLWLRSNGATLCAALLDTALLVTAWSVIGAAPDSPLQRQPTEQLPTGLAIFLGQYAFQGLITLVGTPFVYAGVHLTRGWVGLPTH